MSFIREFKQFAMKGNVIDLAVGIIIGAAFGKIVSSFVADIVTPGLGLLIGGVNFTDLKMVLGVPIDGLKPVTINYGMFIQNIFDFIIIALALFVGIKAINKLKFEEPVNPAPVPDPKDVQLLEEIRDLLKQQISK